LLDAMQAIPFNPCNPILTASEAARVFGAIVAIVSGKTGMDYTAVFSNRVKKDNADLLRGPVDPTNHTWPLTRLLNRADQADGFSRVACVERATDAIERITNRFLPALSKVPTAAAMGYFGTHSRATGKMRRAV